MGNQSNKPVSRSGGMSNPNSNDKGSQRHHQAPAYPSQAQGYPAQPPVNYQHQAPQGNPPPYAPPGQLPPGYGYQATAPHPYYAGAPPPPQPQTVYMQGGFDAGARFGVGAQPNIPPPPPGCMPNAAQAAAAQGHNVVVSQQKGDYFSGGSDGGYTVW